ncbi:tyrosine-type recombinase/integrase [Chloroflexota bacterium]
MDIKDIFERYEMDFRARGYSEKTIIHNEASVRYFIRYLGNGKGMSKVTGDDLRRFQAALRDRNAWEGLSLEKEKKLSGTTINTYSRAIKSFWKWLKKEGIIAKNPLESVPNPKKPETIPKVYSEDEVRAIFRLLPEGSRERAIIDIILDSGIRLSELVSLELSNINFETGRIKVFGKGGKERYTYIESSAIKAINDYVNKSRPQPVRQDKLFLSRDGYPLSGDRIQKILAAIGKEAGLSERLAPHKLRHTCATLLLKYGDNLEHIRLIFGHSNIKTTSKSYLNVADHDVAAAHRKSSPLENILLKQSENTELDKDTHPTDFHGKPSTTKPDPSNVSDGVLEADTSVKLKPLHRNRIEDPPPFRPKYFAIDIESDSILIESIQVITSDPEIPYRLMLFAKKPPEDMLFWEHEELIKMKCKRQRVITFLPAKPLPYRDIDRQKQLHAAIGPLTRPIRVDLDYETERDELLEYYYAPVTYRIVLRYLIQK